MIYIINFEFIAESKHVGKIYCTPGNGGISKYAECFSVGATDVDGVVALAKELKPDMVVVAPCILQNIQVSKTIWA